MAPYSPAPSSTPNQFQNVNNTREQIIVEAWGQGFNVGALVLITLVVLCNYRRNVLLHKLILLELVLALGHGFFIFFPDPAYGWVLSATAVPLYISYNLHNVVAWIKIKPFLPRWGGLLFIISLAAVQPYWILETWANFSYFNRLGNNMFEDTRYVEAPLRDPWWIFTTIKLVLVINNNYEYTLPGLIRTSPRFGVMLLCMFLSIVFLVTDIIVTACVSVQSGINPFWRLALVFKCASDAIFLDDFKSVLDRIAESALKYVANLPYESMGENKDGKPPVASGRRRGSSVGFRRSSAMSRFNGNQPRHVVHISADSGPNGGSAVGTTTEPPHFRYSRDNWPSTHVTSPREEGNLSDQQRAIRADTTITIQENDELRHKTSPGPHNRTSSQEHILPVGVATSTPPDYGWGDPPTGGSNRPNDEEMGIPMMPMRAKTSDRFG